MPRAVKFSLLSGPVVVFDIVHKIALTLTLKIKEFQAVQG